MPSTADLLSAITNHLNDVQTKVSGKQAADKNKADLILMKMSELTALVKVSPCSRNKTHRVEVSTTHQSSAEAVVTVLFLH